MRFEFTWKEAAHLIFEQLVTKGVLDFETEYHFLIHQEAGDLGPTLVITEVEPPDTVVDLDKYRAAKRQ